MITTVYIIRPNQWKTFSERFFGRFRWKETGRATVDFTPPMFSLFPNDKYGILVDDRNRISYERLNENNRSAFRDISLKDLSKNKNLNIINF